jgi:succinoglycan biosynthesis protein ExoA
MSTALISEQIPFAAPQIAAAGPTVSVIIPCYNEERFIVQALENLANQYACEAYELVVVDGRSTDRTRELVAEFQRSHPDLAINVLDNPARNIPHALNLGIAAARGEIIARMDAHAAPSAGYVRRCVEILSESEAAVVGMPCQVQPGATGVMARSIALAVSHPFGIGDAKYRLGSESHESPIQEDVDTVAFACFWKSTWRELGGFDEQLLTNEDYDFNYRVRARGERVVLDRSAHCVYFARATFAKLAAQYFRYGVWKARMIRQRPRSTKLRQLVAPAFVVSIIGLGGLGFWRSAFWALLAIELAVYLFAAFVFALTATRKQRAGLSLAPAMAIAFFTIHFSWGTSFCWGLATPAGKK